MAEIGNRKERLRVREAGASAAGRGQRPYASFPDDFDFPLRPLDPHTPQNEQGHPASGNGGYDPDYCPAGHVKGLGLRWGTENGE